MKNFLRHFRLSENLNAHGNYKTPRRSIVYFFVAIIFLLDLSVVNSQRNFLSANSSSNFTGGNFQQQKNDSRPHINYFDGKGDYSPGYFATYTSSQNGSWNHPLTWGGAGIPGAGDDVVIDADNIVTIDAGSQVRNILVNG